MSDIAAQLTDAVGAAVDSAIVKHEHGFATRWVAVVESVDQDGVRGLWVLNPAGSKTWDVLGLLDYAQAMHRASIQAPETDK